MIWVLRNIGVRLWLTALVAVPFCFYVLSRAGRFLPGIPPGIFALLTVVFWYTLISSLMHTAGRKMIAKLLQEADIWERIAILNKTRKKYSQAVRIYDSFLLSPLAAGKIQLSLTRSLARFSLISGSGDERFRQAVLVHLTSDPLDEILAVLWLKQIDQYRTASVQEQDLLTRLAGIHYTNPRLMPMLARIFLNLERMDFTARQLYARVLEDPALNENYRQQIHTLLRACS